MKICILYAGKIDKKFLEELRTSATHIDSYLLKSKYDLFKKNSYRPAFCKSIDSEDELLKIIKNYDLILEQIDFMSKNIASSVIKKIEDKNITFLKFKTTEKASKNPKVLSTNDLLDYIKNYL